MDAVGRDTPVTLRAGPAGPNGGEVHGQRWPTEYRVGVTRTPAYLAAVASSAVPGLDAVAVRAARGAPGNRCDVGFVTDTQRRAWVVRVPTTSAIGAQLDTAADLLPLLNRRVPYSVPLPRGFLAVPEGRAVVYPYLHGRSVVLSEVIPGPGVAAEIGRAVAALHNVERAVFDEAGVPVYDAETCRTRHLGDLDRGAATGHVPTALLSRWERALEDVSAWRFAPTPVHADLSGGRFLVTFADDENPETASVRAVTGWEHAKIADPADDFAVLVAECSPETFESIVEAYSVARIERPDRHLRHRARLVSELRLLSQLLDAVHAAEPPLITRRAAELRALDERTANEPDLVVTEPEVAPRLPTGGPVATYAAAGAAPTGGADDVPDVLEDDTQLLKTGPAADATAVIPAEELDRLRGEPAPAPEPETPAQADSESWYEVLELTPSEPTPEAEDVTLDEDLDENHEPEAAPAPETESEPVAEDLAEDVVTEEAPTVDEPAPPTPAEPSDAEPADSTAPIKQARPRANRRRR
jgi:aminoglycoside phosphotransferase (APT) family kinase protein